MVYSFRTSRELHYFESEDFEIVRGDSRELLLIITGINAAKLEQQSESRYTTLQNIPDNSDLEEPFDLTGATVSLSVRKTENSDALLVEKTSADPNQINIINPTQGRVEIYFIPTDTEDLEIGEYFYDIQIDTDAGNRYTAVKGKIFLLGDVVR